MKVAFTGGGSAGHVTPNIALIEQLLAQGDEVHYFGTAQGIEHELIAPLKIPYHTVSSERLRRYFDWRNFLTPFKVIAGLLAAVTKVHQVKPDVLFSKGGFVSFPVVVGAWVNRIPVIIHESDLSPGLANKLSFPFATKICVGFKEAMSSITHKEKVVFTGSPLRQAIFDADVSRAHEELGLDPERKIIMVTGGSQGARHINEVVRQELDTLLKLGQVVHLCGKGNLDERFEGRQGYLQLEYLNERFADLMAASSVVICRAGANTLLELVKLERPSVLIPLPLASSRGDQHLNAKNFQAQGMAKMLPDEQLNGSSLLEAVEDVLANQARYQEALRAYDLPESKQLICDLIKELGER